MNKNGRNAVRCVSILLLLLAPAMAFADSQTTKTDGGSLEVRVTYDNIVPREQSTLLIEFINPQTNKVQEHIDYSIHVYSGNATVFGPAPIIHSSEGEVRGLKVQFPDVGAYTLDLSIMGILFQPIDTETASLIIPVGTVQSREQIDGCLEAAAPGSGIGPHMRYLLDATVAECPSQISHDDSHNGTNTKPANTPALLVTTHDPRCTELRLDRLGATRLTDIQPPWDGVSGYLSGDVADGSNATAGWLLWGVYTGQFDSQLSTATMRIDDMTAVSRGDELHILATLHNLGPGPITHVIIGDISVGDIRIRQNGVLEDGEAGGEFADISIWGHSSCAVHQPIEIWDDAAPHYNITIPCGPGATLELQGFGAVRPLTFPGVTSSGPPTDFMPPDGDTFLPGDTMVMWLVLTDGSGDEWFGPGNLEGERISIQMQYVHAGQVAVTDYRTASVQK